MVQTVTTGTNPNPFYAGITTWPSWIGYAPNVSTSTAPYLPPNLRGLPPNKSGLSRDVLNLFNKWREELILQESQGLFNAADLERVTLKLLQIAHPARGFFDANTLIRNHPAVDILSADRSLGIQVKLTLGTTIRAKAQAKWAEHTQPNMPLHGATTFWLLGASTDPRTPNKRSQAWAQKPHDEWARIHEKLELTSRSVDELNAIRDVLAEELRIAASPVPDEQETIRRLALEFGRSAIADLSDAELNNDDCVAGLEETVALIETGLKTSGSTLIYHLMPRALLSPQVAQELGVIIRRMKDVRVQIAKQRPVNLRPNLAVDVAKVALQIEVNDFAERHNVPGPVPNLMQVKLPS